MYEALEQAGHVRDRSIRVAGYDARLTPDMDGFLGRSKRLIEETAALFGEKFTVVPRGFLKGLLDILNELQQSTPSLADEILSAGIDADRIEAIEREETHLIDHI